uniref:PNT domain-containing protein n=1 Tax=Timema tahoe TaxID=61484 RepID=A0A7R9IMU3_9NEOP|nr:unnamed protein product [Timema tahoe]
MLRPAIVHCPRDPPIIRPSLPPPLKAAMPAPFRPPASYSLTFIEDINYPRLWSETHVAHWLYWAIREFSLEGVPLNQFHMRGKDICAMGKEAFLARAPPFMGDILWEHLEILQKVERQSTSIVPLAEVLRLEAGNQRHLGPEVVAAQLILRSSTCSKIPSYMVKFLKFPLEEGGTTPPTGDTPIFPPFGKPTGAPLIVS